MGVALYALAMWAYFYAVFTKPGSPMESVCILLLARLQNPHHLTVSLQKRGYSHLPTTETSQISSITTKGNGEDRYCKKCQCKKPDRTHHCSSCRSCVLKMDHHCPWLANCLGLYNYKAFLLFLIYTSLLCHVCFGVSFNVVYNVVFAVPDPTKPKQTYPSGSMDDLAPVNWILLIVVSGIIGLVLTGFTIWHLILTSKNMTTIESLEKVRYTVPYLRSAPAGAQLVGNDAQHERQHEFNRYNDYLLEESSKKLPHAFNLGRARNFAQVFGGKEKCLLWPFPIFTGIGDGWNWETSPVWREAVEVLRVEREQRIREQGELERQAGWGYNPNEECQWNNNPNPEGLVKYAGTREGGRSIAKAEMVLGKAPKYRDIDSVPMRNLKPNRPMGLLDDISSDEEDLELDDWAEGDHSRDDGGRKVD